MKKYFILTSMLALTACSLGGGSGGGRVDNPSYGRTRATDVYTTPSNIRSANSAVTGMETFSSNADAIVALVGASGIDLTSDDLRVSPRLATHRSGSVIADELSAAFETSGTIKQKLAMAELENLYKIATDDDYWNEIEGYAHDDFIALVHEAFILRGIEAEFNEGNPDAMREAIQTGFDTYKTNVLDKLVAKDGGDYLWTPKINTLEEVNFMLAGENSKLMFTLDENGKIDSVAKYDWDNEHSVYDISEEGIFYRERNGNKFSKELTKYSFMFDNTDIDEIISSHFTNGISFLADADDLEADDIKTKLIEKVTTRVNKIRDSQQGTPEQIAANQAKCNDARDAYIAQINEKYGLYDVDEEETVFWTQSTQGEISLIVNGVNNGLKFADLGVAALTSFHENDNGDATSDTLYAPYVGGYDSRKVDKEHITDGTVFTGTVIAGIDHKDDFEDIEEGMLVRQNNAKLTMNHDGSASLVMNNLVAIDEGHVGAQWYNVTANVSADGKPSFVIDDDGKTNIPEGFELHTLEAGENYNQLTANFTGSPDSESRYTINGETPVDEWYTNYGGSMEASAYGVTQNVATEATSRFGFSEIQHQGGDDNREVAIYGAFGGKK